jgi:translation initiation factor IF-2
MLNVKFLFKRRYSLKRPPIVTIMGHVDHGKTSMLDYLRKTRLAASEAGGITQHIGAFQVALKDHPANLITFIDTPGHAAFSAIRQRGAQVTDLIVLVVAVEDGVMPQTDEVIQLAKSSSIPLIVAMNKWDKLIATSGSASAATTSPQVRKLKETLARRGIELEEFGGSVQCLPVSALTGFNMDALQESILAEAEMMDLRSDPAAPLRATVIEARNVPGLGACATAIIREGTLRSGMFCATDSTYTRVRSLTDTLGAPLKSAGPSKPCEITGWKNSILPQIGTDIIQFTTEPECKKFLESVEREKELVEMHQAQSDVTKRESLDRQLLQLRKERSRDLSLKPIHILSYESLDKSRNGNVKSLQIILHADVTGSLEALNKALSELPRDKVRIEVISSELGPPTPSSLLHIDPNINIAMVAFNVSVPKSIEKSLKDRGAKLVRHQVIYHLLDDVRATMSSLLPPIETDVPQGSARVLQLFPLGKEVVAGCTIDDGLFIRSQAANIKYSLERNGKSVWTGHIKTLKHLKKDITQAQKGMECGIVLDGLDSNLIQVNDSIKCIKIIQSLPKI